MLGPSEASTNPCFLCSPSLSFLFHKMGGREQDWFFLHIECQGTGPKLLSNAVSWVPSGSHF